MEGIKLDSLENIETVMPQLEAMFANDSKSIAIGPKVVAPLAEAILTLTREIKAIRNGK